MKRTESSYEAEIVTQKQKIRQLEARIDRLRSEKDDLTPLSKVGTARLIQKALRLEGVDKYDLRDWFNQYALPPPKELFE